MNTWRIMLAHHLAHLNPTLTTGTAVAGYPIGSLRTLNPQERGRVTSASTNLVIDWDRGANGNHNPIDALLLVGQCNIATAAYEVYSDTASDFPTPLKYLDDGSNAFDSIVPRMCLFTTTGAGAELASTIERYMRMAILAAGDDTYDFGVISMGKQHLLGTDLYAGASESAESGAALGGEGSRIITRSFDDVTDANAAAILAAWRKDSIMDTANAYVDGWGQKAGQRFGALAKFSSATAVTSDEVYYGNINLTVEPKYEGKSQVNVQVRTVEVGPIQT